MSSIHNPFQSLYVTERVNELDFPAMFSPNLIPLVLPLFQPGNVMLSGIQGTGKTMLLSLLDSQFRLSFWRDKNNPYPVEADFCKFVGANINLSTSLVMKFNERSFASDSAENISRSQAVFSDYLNTWVIRDLLQSVEMLIEAPKARLRESGINATRSKLDAVAKGLSQSHECSGLVAGADNLDAAIEALTLRLRTYLDFINFKLDEVPENVWSSITGIGEPISVAANILKKVGIIKRGTEVFVTIDQCEELLRLEQSDTEQQEYGRYRIMLDKLISSRDRAVSYRLGTRPNAIWKGKSEEVRDYIKVDLDMLFKKKEHSTSLFPKFAEDVFFRRLRENEEPVDEQSNLLHMFFGRSPSSSQRASECTPLKRPERVLKLDKEDWPNSVKATFDALASEDVLSAKLGVAWYRQTLAKTRENARVSEKEKKKAKQELEQFIAIGKQPWQEKGRKWWKKERTGQAILQIAASNAQRIPYYGKMDIMALSGRNILVFALICQKIWEAWLQQTNAKSSEVSVPRPFSKWRQDEGIRAASDIWHDKISTAPDADTVRRLIDELGSQLRRQLRGDKAMSYPGANGISLSNTDLETDREIKEMLEHATAEGFLQVSRHTPKVSSRGHSRKWYTHPILAPFYELTVAHTKEPLYLTVDSLRTWLEKANVVERRGKSTKKPRQPKPNSAQQTLFDEETDE